MSVQTPTCTRFLGLDVHKHYLIAAGVDAHMNPVYGPRRVPLTDLETWMRQTLSAQDAVVLEMTTNAWQLYDELLPYVGSVTLVHPPHIALITRAQVMTDRIAAFTLARLHAAGLLPGVWVPPQPVRDQRALVASRAKMVRLATQAKNRLHAVLHRHHFLPSQAELFTAAQRSWWLDLPVTPMERVRIQCDLDTLAFADSQLALMEGALAAQAAQDQRMVLLVQLPGLSLISACTLLAAIGDIRRFPSARQLVGYAGLGGRVHDSGLTHRAGRITKAGRRDIRATMVEAAHTATRTHPHWQAQLARLEPHLGHNKAIVAIARKLLVVVWHVLSECTADRFACPPLLARKLAQYTYRLGKAHRPVDQSVAQAVRSHLDRLGLGVELSAFSWGPHKSVPLPPSTLPGA